MSNPVICIGAEKKPNESRRAMSPQQAHTLQRMGYKVIAQRFPESIFPDSNYAAAGIDLVDSTQSAGIVVATKEFSQRNTVKVMHQGQMLMCFHHVHK